VTAPDNAAGADRPRQAWAHRDRLVDLQSAAPASWTPAAIQARLQIADTFYRFAIAHDEARIDVLASCFTENGRLHVSQARAEPFTSHQGRSSIGAALAHIIAQQHDQRRHLISNIVVEALGDFTATAIAYGLISVASPDGGLHLGCSAIYLADLALEHDGCWRFASFHIGIDAYAGIRPAPLAQAVMPRSGLAQQEASPSPEFLDG
jgi:hypothetical protein